jgi:hypothetical protein
MIVTTMMLPSRSASTRFNASRPPDDRSPWLCRSVEPEEGPLPAVLGAALATIPPPFPFDP